MKRKTMTDKLLYVVCPHWDQGAATVHETPGAAAGEALLWDKGARVVVVDLATRKPVADITVQAPKKFRSEAHAEAFHRETESRIAEASTDNHPS